MSIKGWWGDVNPKRVGYGVLYLILGLIVGLCFCVFRFCLCISDRICSNWKDLLWIFSWSCIGIGAGLLNSRTDKSKNNEGNLNEHMHYIVYYPFVLFMSILASFALSREGGYLDYPKSTLIAVTLGFAAERIHDLLSGKITT